MYSQFFNLSEFKTWLQTQTELIANDLNTTMISDQLETLSDFWMSLDFSKQTWQGLLNHYQIIDPDDFPPKHMAIMEKSLFEHAWQNNPGIRWFQKNHNHFQPVSIPVYMDLIHDVNIAFDLGTLIQTKSNQNSKGDL